MGQSKNSRAEYNSTLTPNSPGDIFVSEALPELAAQLCDEAGAVLDVITQLLHDLLSLELQRV